MMTVSLRFELEPSAALILKERLSFHSAVMNMALSFRCSA